MKHLFSKTYEDIALKPMSMDDALKYRVLRNRNRKCFFYDGIISAEEQIKWYQNYLVKDGEYMFSIYKDESFIGGCGLYGFKENTCEFGRIVVDNAGGDGCGTKALQACIEVVRENFTMVNKVVLYFSKNNIKAKKSYLKAGFTIEEFDNEKDYGYITL